MSARLNGWHYTRLRVMHAELQELRHERRLLIQKLERRDARIQKLYKRLREEMLRR